MPKKSKTLCVDDLRHAEYYGIAWNKVIQKHDMLRAIVSNSGYQIVQEAVPYVTIQCLDLRITEGNNETDKNDFRRRLANKQYELGKWPMCDLALTVENEKSIIHLSLDMLIADFVSTNIILHDLETFYENPDLIIVPTTLYRDVVLYQNQKRTIKTVERNVAEKYWSDKIPSILFRVFSQNFRCVSTYEPKPYYGNMRILCCEIQGGHFYPGFFAEDYETWKPYAKGNLTFDLIKGWHLDCITEPNLGENIKKMLDFNY